ncbi:MAG TPA: FG-GAP-like repeat-containing protein, partial [Dongiaceae bacterium]|nr:FG-GAP-like repeat-containing protein [Dongiaceae bacterium]
MTGPGPAGVRRSRRVAMFVAAVAAIGFGVAGGAAPKLKEGASLEDLYHANNRGAALMEQYRSAQAMEEFSKVTDLAPGWAPGQANLGLAALYARQTDTAEKAFVEAIRLDPRRVQGAYGLALLYKGQGKGPEAIAAFEKARALDPEDPDILYNLGVLFGRERRFPEAIAALDRARQIDPNNMSVRYQLARALLQSGNKTRGETEMAAYQKLAANPKFAQPTGNQYGEAGRYALVVVDYRDLGGPPAPADPIVVRFSDATATSGVTFKHAGPGGGAAGGGASIAARGSGVGLGDLDGDGRVDLVFANADAAGKAGPAVFRNRGEFVFEEITAASQLAYHGAGLGVALGDYDNDGDLDVALTGSAGLALWRNDGAARFDDVTAAAGASVAGVATGAAWGDVDHDGDLDLYVPRLSPAAGKPAGAALLLNRGDGTFAESAAALKLQGPTGGAVGALFSDLDLDRDIDVVVSAAGGPDALLDNRRDQGFADAGRAAGLAAKGAGRGVASGDVDGDGRPDLVFASGTAGGNVLLINGARRPMSRHLLPSPRGGVTYGVTLFDADNDGDLDLFAVGSALLYLRNDGRARFTDATAEAGLETLSFKDGRAVGAADFDGDDDLDLVTTQNNKKTLPPHNEDGH